MRSWQQKLWATKSTHGEKASVEVMAEEEKGSEEKTIGARKEKGKKKGRKDEEKETGIRIQERTIGTNKEASGVTRKSLADK